MNATIQSNIDEFNAAFLEYLNYTKKAPQEALERKVANIGIRLWKGFTAHEWGGIPRKKGIAKAELAARTAEHRGTVVRPSLLAEYAGISKSLKGEARDLKKQLRNFGGTLDDWVGTMSSLKANIKKRISAWQEIVGREIRLRQSGIGALGAAFLWYRYRGKGEAKRIVKNRTGHTIGSVEVGDGMAVVTAEVAGINTVDERYGIVRQAISDETDDTMLYIRRKLEEQGALLPA